jgi:hypothetical protein
MNECMKKQKLNDKLICYNNSNIDIWGIVIDHLDYNTLIYLRITNKLFQEKIDKLLEQKDIIIKYNFYTIEPSYSIKIIEKKDFDFSQDLPLTVLKYYFNNITKLPLYIDTMKIRDDSTEEQKILTFRVILFNYVSFSGNINNLSWLKENKCPYKKETVAYGFNTNNIKAIRWFITNKYKYDHSIFKFPILNENINFLELLKKRNCPYDKKVFAFAAEHGKIKIMKWLKENNYEYDNDVFTKAVKFGNIEHLEWLKINKFPCTPNIIDIAVCYEKQNVLIWLKKKNYNFTNRTFNFSITTDNIQIMEWLKNNNCPILLDKINDFVIESKKMETIKYLKNIGFHCVPSNLISAMKRNNIEILEWLKQVNCPINIDVYRYVLDINDQNKLKWLKDNYNWENTLENQIFNYAIKKSTLDIIKWLHENNCPHTNTSYLFNTAVDRGDMDILKYLKSIKILTSTSTYTLAAEKSNLEILDYLKKIGCRLKSYAFVIAVRTGNLETIEWFKKQNWLNKQKSNKLYMIFDEAVKRNNTELMEWLETNGFPINK